MLGNFTWVNMASYNTILEQLKVEQPQDIPSPIEPYNYNDDLKTKLDKAHLAIRNSQRVGTNHNILINAYFTGKIIEDNPLKRKSLRKRISDYFYHVSVRVYHIFHQLGPEQIYRINGLGLNHFRKLKSNKFKQLVRDAIDIKTDRLMNLIPYSADEFSEDVKNQRRNL